MNVLVVATKAPWPAIDGGRLLLRNMLEGLAAAGHRATLVAPVDPARFDLATVAQALAGCCTPRLVRAAPSSPPAALLRAARTGEPLSIARHALPAVRREVERSLREERFDVLHAEQLQALPQVFAPGSRAGLPVVLRAQNVESDLWRETALRSRGGRRLLLGIAARRLARWEGEAVRRAAATLALTAEDAARLRVLAGLAGSGGDGGRVSVVRAPFPELPPAAGEPLPGEPAVVVLGSQGWLPNEDSASWFLAEVWPAVVAVLPGAVLHLFGAVSSGRPGPLPAGVSLHPSPRGSAEAFRPGAVLAVPLRIASGVRMKVLEAWARGVPVVATPAALAGLEVEDGREALVATDGPAFAAALAHLHREPGLAGRLTEEGRRARREHHDPALATAGLVTAYERAISYFR